MSYELSVLDAAAATKQLRAVPRGGLLYAATVGLPQPALAPPGRPGTALLAGSRGAAAGGSGWGESAAATRDFAALDHAMRVRADGVVRRVRLSCLAADACTGLWMVALRKSGNYWYPAALSGDLHTQLVGGNATILNDIWLPDPMSVLRGDYLGYSVTGTGAGNQFSAVTGLAVAHTEYRTGPYATRNGENVTTWTNAAGVSLPLEWWGDRPDACLLGDSLMAGHPLNYSFLEETDTTDATSDPSVLLEAACPGWRVHNLGVGSQTMTTISARAAAALAASRPGFVVLEGGVNDLAAGGITPAVYAAQVAAIAQLCLQGGTALVYSPIWPWTNGTNVQLQERDIYNAAAIAAVEPYGAIIASVELAIGQFRALGDPGNLWDIKAAYDTGDGVHLNPAGYAAAVAAIAAALPLP